MKHDVALSIDPPQEETTLEVELTGLQEKYYRAIYEQVLQYHSTSPENNC
jgi:SNF2 family DNA or RNA helicase